MRMSHLDEFVLRGPDGSLRLSILRYQFPSLQDELDANWLVIGGHACLEGKEWSFKDPCLTTFEVQRLADWLDQTALNNTNEGTAFIEPNLQFDRVSAANIRVSMAYESAPPWAALNDPWDLHGFEVPVGPELIDAAAALRRQLNRFPVRGLSER